MAENMAYPAKAEDVFSSNSSRVKFTSSFPVTPSKFFSSDANIPPLYFRKKSCTSSLVHLKAGFVRKASRKLIGNAMRKGRRATVPLEVANVLTLNLSIGEWMEVILLE